MGMPRVTVAHCSPASPLMCAGRGNATAPGVWLDHDTMTWYWSDGTGILQVTHCPFCGFPLPLMGVVDDTLRLFERALRDEPLADPEE